MDDDARELDELVQRWQTGYGDVRDLYDSLRDGMHQTARRGIQRVTAKPPDEHRVQDVVYIAFTELLRGDPAAMTSPVGLAKTIAYRRGIDEGRKILRERQRISSLDAVDVAGTLPDRQEILAAAEEEALHQLAAQCMESLTTDQRSVVQATVLGSQTLSDWALIAGTSHQAVSRLRSRALDSLRRCVNRHRTRPAGKEPSRGRS
ncbi:MAG: sigma factor-like helix-turn-helix DNA-binding protein [Jatrophihabitantaceae bacterium]